MSNVRHFCNGDLGSDIRKLSRSSIYVAELLVDELAVGAIVGWKPTALCRRQIDYIAGRPTQHNISWLPLVIFNTGASPVVVESLRLVSPSSELGTLLSEAVEEPIWTSVHPIKIERDSFFLPTVIRPNDIIKKNFVFTSGISDRDFHTVLYNFELEAKISGYREWQKLKHIEIDLRDPGAFSSFELNTCYRVYPYKRGERAYLKR